MIRGTDPSIRIGFGASAALYFCPARDWNSTAGNPMSIKQHPDIVPQKYPTSEGFGISSPPPNYCPTIANSLKLVFHKIAVG
jgi:hypothetical protein